jgi:hypothetical protein
MTDNQTKIKYLVDANVLIDLSLWKPISLNWNNEFWLKLSKALEFGDWVLLDVVVKEVKYDHDNNSLIKWLKELNKSGLITKLENEYRVRGVEINNQYRMIDATTGKSEVDTYLIAFAEANNLGIFSRESFRKNIADLYKIPDVCQILNIKRVNKPKAFFKEIGFD